MDRYVGSPPFQWQGEINRESEQLRGLVGWWTGQPASASIIYNRSLATLALNGTPYNGVTTAATEMGSALSLDGTNDYVSIAANALLNNAYVTLSCWFWTNNSINNKMMIMKAHSSHASPYYLLGMRHAGGNALYMDLTVNGAWQVAGGFSAPNGQWNHAAISYDGAKILCFTNGVLRSTVNISGTAATTNTPLLFGANNNLGKTSTYCWPGYLHDIRLYNRGLSAAEIWSLYDPQTRWELYATPEYRRWFVPVVAGTSIPVFQHSYRQRRA